MVNFMLCLFYQNLKNRWVEERYCVMVVRADLLEDGTFEQRYEKQELVSLEDTWRKSSLGRGNCTNKSQEAELCLVRCENY